MLTVLGSANLDITLQTDRLPHAGETITAHAQQRHAGGKGANQAAAAALLGAKTAMIGAVGQDEAGQWLLQELQRRGVGVQAVCQVEEPTGSAFIVVDRCGANQIVVLPGANARVTPAQVRAHRKLIEKSRLFLCQQEVPAPAVAEGLRLAKEAGAFTLLNPAPARPLEEGVLRLCDCVAPNEHELAALTGLPVESEGEVARAAGQLLAGGAGCVVVTLGERGAALFLPGEEGRFFPALPVRPVDTTGAGDTFLGGFAAAFLQGMGLEEAIGTGQLAAAYAVQRPGAMEAMPTRAKLQALAGALGVPWLWKEGL